MTLLILKANLSCDYSVPGGRLLDTASVFRSPTLSQLHSTVSVFAVSVMLHGHRVPEQASAGWVESAGHGPEQCVLSSASVRGAEITHWSCWVSLCCFSSVCTGNVLNLEEPALNHIFLSKRTEKGPGIYVCVWHFCSLFPIPLSRPRSCFVFFFDIIWLWFPATQTDLSACSLKSNKLLIAFPNYPVYCSCRLGPLLV